MTEEYDPLASVQAAGPPGTISFIYGLPDPATFPVADLRRAADQVLRERPELALQYGPEQGYGPLIDHLRAKIAREEGLALERPHIMLTGGSAQAIDHLCTLFTQPGDRVLVEAPTYHETLQLFRDHGLAPLQVATDEGGLQVEALANRLEALARRGQRAHWVYTIPNFQNPSGITLAADRRPVVLALAERYDLDLARSWLYSDSAADVPLFERVGNPVVVNPKDAFRPVAVQRGWQILEWKERNRGLAPEMADEWGSWDG